MRAVSAFFGAGIMDRYPDIRYCILESGFGWLPFWGARMDDQSIYMSYALPENLARKPSEYMTSGRFFASLVIHEGEKMAKMVTDFLGDGVLMYSSDYPHAESRFPESTNKVLAWKSLGTEVMRKMLWDNAAKCFGEPPSKVWSGILGFRRPVHYYRIATGKTFDKELETGENPTAL
jgi:predicted TIM-barrel fold metal-dependent hydrolase